MLRIGEVAIILGVCQKTLRRWDTSGHFPATWRTEGGHRRYAREHVDAFLDNRPLIALQGTETIGYARVSSSKQRTNGDLARQQERIRAHCAEQGWTVERIYTDVGSGLNDQRRGLHQLLAHVGKGTVARVVVTYQDRFSRFGKGILESYLEAFGSDLHLIHEHVVEGEHAQLVTDLTAMLYSFMGKLYRKRRGPAEASA